MITLLFLCFQAITSFNIPWPEESIIKLRLITAELLSGNPCNIEALNACSLKTYMFTKDPYVLGTLGYFHLFGFPQNEGDQYLEFCQNFGDFSIPRLQQNESTALKYFKQTKAEEYQLYIAFIEWNRFKKNGKPPKQIHLLQYSSLTYNQLAHFNYHYNCKRFQKIEGLELSNKFERLYHSCQSCQQLMMTGAMIANDGMIQYNAHREELEMSNQDFVILQQMAENGNEAAQFQYAYSLYAGNEDLGIQRDEQRSMEIFSNMTKSREALFAVGVMNRDHGNYQIAAQYFRNAIEEFEMPEAYHELGNLYFFGNGVREDKVKAKQLYQQAADLGFASSQVVLAQLHMETNVTEGMEMLINSTESNAKWIMVITYIQNMDLLDQLYGCERFLNMTKELISLSYYSAMSKLIDNSTTEYQKYMFTQLTAFVGVVDPLDDEEAALYRIPGAATRLAHKQTNLELKKKLYQQDLSPESYISLSKIEYEEGNLTLAYFWVNKLIKECHNEEWEFNDLIIAYMWKLSLYILSLFS